MKILLIAPIKGNGGIKSWADKFEKNFKEDDFECIRISGTDRRVSNYNAGVLRSIFDGFMDMVDVCRDTNRLIAEKGIDIMHTTTSGRMGSLRDYMLSRICRKRGVKSILHCRYGSIPQLYYSNTIIGFLLRHTMYHYDNVWVLDRRSKAALEKDPRMKGKVFLTPNTIIVPTTCDLSPKDYHQIAFVGNVQEDKGPLHLLKAVVNLNNDTMLHIVGPITDEMKNRIKTIAGSKYDNQIKVYGKLPNDKAVELMKTFDIIALPSFYIGEAFPISILEAMSKGKLVISTDRAAIPDMLTAEDGSQCGIIVREQNSKDIEEAIIWCQSNTVAADDLCKKAYEKVWTSYRQEVVYKLYSDLYHKLLY